MDIIQKKISATPPATLSIPLDRPGPVVADLFTGYKEALQSRPYPRSHWYASDATACPRRLWYYWHGYGYSHDLAAWNRMRWGGLIEHLEQEIQAITLPKLNTKSIHDLLPHYPQVQAAVEGALKATRLKDGEPIARFAASNITSHAIYQLPFHITVPGLEAPISCVADAIVAYQDKLILQEIKSTSSWATKQLKQGDVLEALRLDWAVQTALYMATLSLPGRIHVWARDDRYYTAFQLDWRGENGESRFCVNGRPLTVGGLDPVDWITLVRLPWLQGAVAAPSPPGHIGFLEPGAYAVRLGLILPGDYPRFRGEDYCIVLDEKNQPVGSVGPRGAKDKDVSSWCHYCDFHSLCYEEFGYWQDERERVLCPTEKEGHP